jgi:hypothetical protein
MFAAEKEIEAKVSSNNSLSDPEKNATKGEEQVDGDEDTTEYLSGLRLGLIILGLCLAVLLVGFVSVCQKLSDIFIELK